MKKRYYVYAHYDEKGKLFYIGKGTRNRDETPCQRSKEWINEAKNGFTSVIIADNLNNKQAFLIEQATIRALNPQGLVNKKIPSDVVLPYWKQPNLPKHYVSTTTDIKHAIQLIENKIEKYSLSEEETQFLKIPRKELSDQNKKRRVKLQMQQVKLKELNLRLKKAKSLQRTSLYA